MSLRTRLVATIAVVALIALGLAGFATYIEFSRSQLHQLDQSLDRAHEPIEEVVAAGTENLEFLVGQTAPGTFVAIQSPDGTTLLLIPAREPGHEQATVGLATITDLNWPTTQQVGDRDVVVYRTVATSSGNDELRLRIALLTDGSTLFIGQPLHDLRESQRQLLIIEIVVASGALLVAIVGGWFLVRAGLRPLRNVEQTALAIAEGGQLSHRASNADDNTEVGRVAKALNTMLDRIDSAFEERDKVEADLRDSEGRMRRFVADVSHELRTPLAAVSAYSELFERGARNHPADLDRAINGIASETSRMNGLVEELLLLARLDEGRPLDEHPVDLAALLVEAVGTARAVAPEFPVALRIAEVVTVTGDATRLRQVVDNLLANVRAHTSVSTNTTIDLHTESNDAVVTIADNGPGMESEEAALIFERFYRVDSSRSRQTGGSGLGMSIVKAIVAAHQGRVDLQSAPGRGVVVTIRLPLADEAT